MKGALPIAEARLRVPKRVKGAHLDSGMRLILQRNLRFVPKPGMTPSRLADLF